MIAWYHLTKGLKNCGRRVRGYQMEIELPKEESYTSLVDGQPVVPDDRAGHALSDGDEITLLPAIQGG